MRLKPLAVAAAIGAAIFLLLVYPVVTGSGGQKEITVHVYHAVMGPVYQRLPDNTTIMVKVDIYYPDKLYLHPPNLLGRVNFTVYTNWSGPWDGIVTVQVVDPGYHIDPTLFKPVESMFEWGEGGAALGSGSLHAATYPVLTRNVTRSVEIVAHERYFNSTPGVYEAQYFFKVRLAFFDNESGQKIPGGDINIYTSSDGAPRVKILVRKPASGKGDVLKMIVANAALAGGVALIAYIIADQLVFSRRR